MAFWLNAAFVVVEVVGGLLTNSVSILSDALHDAGDVLVLGLAFVLERLSHRSPTPAYSYGYRRLSVLAAVLTNTVVFMGSLAMAYAGIQRLSSPEPVHSTGMMLLALAGIAINGAAAFRLRGERSLSGRAVLLHLAEDAAGWAAVLVGSVVIYATGIFAIDSVLAIAVAAFIGYRSAVGVREAAGILLQSAPEPGRIESILSDIGAIPGVVGAHDMHVWSMDSEEAIATVHIRVSDEASVTERADIRRRVRTVFGVYDVHHVTVEIEDSRDLCSLRDCSPAML